MAAGPVVRFAMRQVFSAERLPVSDARGRALAHHGRPAARRRPTQSSPGFFPLACDKSRRTAASAASLLVPAAETSRLCRS